MPSVPGLDISTRGHVRVRGRRRNLHRLLKQRDNRGYKEVNYKGSTYRVHRLVAEAFIPNPNNYDQVNHINGAKSDNFVSNLEWCNNSMNQIHAINVLGYVNNFGSRKVEVSKDGIVVFVGNTVRAASRFLDCEATQISKVCSGQRNHYKGHKCRYI
jgi:hypothetical protein